MSIQKINYVAELTNEKESWKIGVRVIRLWNVSYSNSTNAISSIQMVLLDQRGDKIQASVSTDKLIKKHIASILEGKCYIIQKFVLLHNNGEYRATHHKFKINFHFGTSIQLIDLDIPLHSFDFVPFEDINKGNVAKGYLLDVIGELDTYGSCQDFQRNGVKSKFMELYLRDNRNNKLQCILFGDYADEVSNTLRNSKEKMLIVVFHLCMISKGAIKVSNSWNASKFMINPNISTVVDFKSSLNLPESSISQRFSQVDTHSKSKSLIDFFSLEARKSLSELKETEQNGLYITLATIMKIETRLNWYFDACSVHGTKVRIDNGLLKCQKCDKTPHLIVQR